MATTSLQLRFRVWGPKLDPESVTVATGVRPSRNFHVGEASGRAAREVAGWEWHSEFGNGDIEPLVADLMRQLGLHEAVFRACADGGARVSLTVVGSVLADLVPTEEEADAKGWYGGEGPEFTPFLAFDRPVIYFDLGFLRFLVAILAEIDTHIDFDLDNQESDAI